jgi:hypothetical protein
MDIVQFVKENWAVIEQAPWVFVTLVVLFGGGGLLGGRYWRADIVTNKDSIIALRDAEISDYKRKLDGASPDEAQARIAALEKRLDALTPVPVEELEHLQHAEAARRQNLIGDLVHMYQKEHVEPPTDNWLNGQIKQRGESWRVVNKGSHYETFEPARWG